MPGRRNPPAKWVLPEVVDPPDRICITIPVPNDRQHIGAFWGALYNLTSARFWQDDLDHTALLVAKVWQDIYDALKPAACDITPPLSIEEWEDALSICESLRFQNGKLQGLCCGEWVDIAGQGDSGLGLPGQPGDGAEQPAIGGDPVCYHGNMPGSLQWLAPTVVSADDTLTFSNFGGAAWDGVSPFPLPGRWDCPDGKYFFAGECQEDTQGTVGSDPLPTAPHMSVIVQIAGTWYSALSVITVPGGVSNAQVVAQLNDSAIADNQGQYSFDCCVKNNQTVAGSFHLFDFTTAPHGWTNLIDSDITIAHGVWTAGRGWVSTVGLTSGVVHRTAVYIKAPAVGSIIATKVTVRYSLTAGQNTGVNDRVLEVQNGSSGLDSVTGLADTADTSHLFTGPYTLNPSALYLACARHDGSDPSPIGECVIKSVRFDFAGSDPYAAF